jgi:hypothetical protein
MVKQLFLILLLTSCSSATMTSPAVSPPQDEKNASSLAKEEFSSGELILATQLLTKIFDQEMAHLECVEDSEEAGLLLRTIRPRMEVVQDDLEAILDDPAQIDNLIKTCDQNCTCSYVDDLLREHQVILTKAQQKLMAAKKSDNEVSRCLNFSRNTFCQGDLYKILDKEKQDFSFEE